MEKKRPQESSPKNQNQNQNQDKRSKVATKKVACSMCKEKKNIESFHPEDKCFWFKTEMKMATSSKTQKVKPKEKKKILIRRKILPILNLIQENLYQMPYRVTYTSML